MSPNSLERKSHSVSQTSAFPNRYPVTILTGKRRKIDKNA